MTNLTRAFVQHGPYGSNYMTPANYNTWWPNQRRGRLDGIGQPVPARCIDESVANGAIRLGTGLGLVIGFGAAYLIWGFRR